MFVQFLLAGREQLSGKRPEFLTQEATMQFQGHFTITRKDNIRFNLLLMKRKLISASIVVFFVIALLVGIIKYMQGFALTAAITQALIMAVLGMILLAIVNVVSMMMRVNSMYKSKKITDFSFDATVDKSGFHATSDRGDSDIPWERILSVTETGAAFYVFITDSNANVLPKPQITNPSDMETLRKLLTKHLPAHKLHLK